MPGMAATKWPWFYGLKAHHSVGGIRTGMYLAPLTLQLETGGDRVETV